MTLSVALCTYNGAQYIKEQIESILAQSMPVDEIVVCDDGSSDETLAIVGSLQNTTPTNIRLYRNVESLGVVENFKKASSLCQGDIVFFSDQDDRWHPGKVLAVVDFFHQTPTCAVVFSNALIIDSSGRYEKSYGDLFQMTFQKEEQRMFFAGLELESFLARNHATGAAMAAKREFLQEAQPFALCNNQILHDYALALRAAELGCLGVIMTPLIDYRRHDKGQTIFEIPKEGSTSKWYTYYDHIHELWPNGDVAKIQSLLTSHYTQERIAYISKRNQNLHQLSAPLCIPFSYRLYHRLYNDGWLKVMCYDIRQCLRYSMLRLTHRCSEN